MNKSDREKLRELAELAELAGANVKLPGSTVRALLDLVDELDGKLRFSRHETQCKEDSKDELKALMVGTQEERQELSDRLDHQRKRAEAWKAAALGYGRILKDLALGEMPIPEERLRVCEGLNKALEAARKLEQEGGE
jgi:hypothetical protein